MVTIVLILRESDGTLRHVYAWLLEVGDLVHWHLDECLWFPVAGFTSQHFDGFVFGQMLSDWGKQ